MNPSPKLLLVAGLSALALAAPGAAQGAVRVSAHDDPGAPQGVTPKVIFSLKGLKPHKAYDISFLNPVSGGQNCDVQPSTIPKRANKHGRLTFDPMPGGENYDSSYEPLCAHKTYKGQVNIVGKHFSTPVRKFKFRYPSLKIRYR
jgi:hypothetical protein